jgi:hypothetical protein
LTSVALTTVGTRTSRGMLLPGLLTLDVATWLYTALHGLNLLAG